MFYYMLVFPLTPPPTTPKKKFRFLVTELISLLQGVLNSYFLNLEYIESGQPHFVEEMIVTYFSQSALYLDELCEALSVVYVSFDHTHFQ